MFPGVGDHYVKMAQGLYQTETVFREQVDDCCERLLPYLKSDLREILYSDKKKVANPKATDTTQPHFDFRKMLKGASADETTQKLNQTIFSQPAVFVIEYSLAKLWMSYGIQPQAMIGYSIGEYVAACIAGVISLSDVLLLLTKRAQMIQELPVGAMLAVPLSEKEIRPLLGEALSIAIISTPSQCVVGGVPETITALEQQLKEREVLCRQLQTSHAFHSKMLATLQEPLTKLVGNFTLKCPKIPYLSIITGTWITDAQATNPHYWAQHTYSTVRFADGIGELLHTPNQIFLEVGPGQSVGSFVFQHPAFQKVGETMVLSSLRTRYEQQADEAFLLNTLGKLWLGGIDLDFSSIF
jgi:acyl transferase domain-containing protein